MINMGMLDTQYLQFLLIKYFALHLCNSDDEILFMTHFVVLSNPCRVPFPLKCTFRTKQVRQSHLAS